jgi:putative aldouronate transport system permease protein
MTEQFQTLKLFSSAENKIKVSGGSMLSKSKVKLAGQNKYTFRQRVKRDFVLNKSLYLMIIPVVLYYVLFCYKPLYGVIIAFKNFSPNLGILKSPWVGLKHFRDFVNSVFFLRTVKNTIVINITNLIFGFPVPIIFALLLNEIKNRYFARTVQTVSYLPYFLSTVVVCGMIIDFTRDTGVINDIIALFGGTRKTLLGYPQYFVPVYVISDIWQEFGWESIIFLAALAGIDQQLYEAAKIDGCNRFQQVIHISVPGIMPTVVTLFILRIGNIMNLGFEKIILLYNPAIYETSDVISSFVYRKGLQEFRYDYSTAVGLFNSVVSFVMLICANRLSRKYNDMSLW